jgi:hypothetical protein
MGLHLGIKPKLEKGVDQLIARQRYSIQRKTDLTLLADQLGSDKGTRFSAHLYTRVYEKFFRRLRDQPLCLLEIGLMRSDIERRTIQRKDDGTSLAAAAHAPSLQMWRKYFPLATLFGFDIDDFSKVDIEGCTIFRGDMSSREDLAKLVSAIDRPIDILIEDASHASHHQQIALGFLFPKLQAGGMYVIEDLHWQDDRLEEKGAPKTKDLLMQLKVAGTFQSPYLSLEERIYIQRNTEKLWLFDSNTTDVEDPTDALAVLIKGSSKSRLP